MFTATTAVAALLDTELPSDMKAHVMILKPTNAKMWALDEKPLAEAEAVRVMELFYATKAFELEFAPILDQKRLVDLSPPALMQCQVTRLQPDRLDRIPGETRATSYMKSVFLQTVCGPTGLGCCHAANVLPPTLLEFRAVSHPRGIATFRRECSQHVDNPATANLADNLDELELRPEEPSPATGAVSKRRPTRRGGRGAILKKKERSRERRT
jgi:hypothetical protein